MRETLCWKCEVPGTGGCSWDRSFEPVEGWTATPTRISLGYNQTSTESFVVHDCPLYRAEKSQKDGRPEICCRRKITDQQLQACIDAGLRDSAIAALFGMSANTVYRRRMKLAKVKKLENKEGKELWNK